MIGYADSDYAGDSNHRRSVSGYTFMLAGCAIAYKSRYQSSVALSSSEAELIAATEAAKDGFIPSSYPFIPTY